MKILIVEDEKESCDNLSIFIAKMDHTVEKSYDGRDAISKIKKIILTW